MYVVLQYFWPVPCILYLHYMVGSNLTVSFISVWIHNSEEYLIIFALTRKKKVFFKCIYNHIHYVFRCKKCDSTQIKSVIAVSK